MRSPLLAGWVPVRFYRHQGRPCVDWAHLGGHRFTEPFFNETVERCFQLPFNLLFRHQTPVETLLEWQQRQPGVPPTGFVFHTSRCGSTLMAQMLAALPRHIVLSEPGPVDGVLDAHFKNPTVTDTQRCAWLRAMVSALGQRWGGGETHLFIKFDSWHTLHLPLIRQAFPDVPWIFLYRDPIEVLVSQMRQRGVQMVPGMVDPALFGIERAEAVRMRPEEYCARVLARFCRAALDHYHDGGLLVNYRQLPGAVGTAMANFFGIPLSADDAEQMRQAAQLDAKNPYLPYTDDSAEKNRSATDLTRQMAEVWVHPLYEQLEAARQGQGEPHDST